MIVRGAPAIGIAAAFGLALASLQSRASTSAELVHDLENAAGLLLAARPTAVNLHWALETVLQGARTFLGGADELRALGAGTRAGPGGRRR